MKFALYYCAYRRCCMFIYRLIHSAYVDTDQQLKQLVWCAFISMLEKEA